MKGSLIPRSWLGARRGLYDLDREFDALFASAFTGWPWAETRRARWPLVESFVKDGQLHVRSDLPGVDPKDVEVSLSDDTLTIRGERKAEHEGPATREIVYGRFERTMAVPEGVDPDKVTARYANGVLEVTLPLPTTRAPHKVPIETESEKAKAA